MKERIPEELKLLPQWVCAGANKLPLNPNTGLNASVTDPRTWGTYNQAVAANQRFIGFVLTNNDPYCIIDLDVKETTTAQELERHARIMEAFQSYTERSASGKGAHIIIRARIPAGARRDSVEIYSAERYMICTGDTINALPIADFDDYANQLFNEMQAGRTKHAALQEFEDQRTDAEIVAMASDAVNAEKFVALCNGDMSAYPSQSEADFALLAILAFYTKSNEQVRRLFRMTKLGKRDKANKNNDYLNRALEKIRGNEAPQVDLSGLKPPQLLTALQPEIAESQPVQQTEQRECVFPPGLTGEIAQYIFESSVRPVREIALAAALALMAGVSGRSYNISGTGLNLYLILLANTGSGKEGASRGIDMLLAAVKQTVPASDLFIGPGAFASGQALVRVLNERPCFVSVLGEFGLTLQQMCDVRANPALVMLKKVLLDLFAKSGYNQMLRPSVYSDTDKNTKLVQSPNVTILGESTPETFFGGLDPSHISEGLIPRFSVISYTGPRPARNKQAGAMPNTILANKLADLINIALSTSANNSCAHVGMSQEALLTMDAFDELCDSKINGGGSDVDHQLWNRAHLKALKLAAVVAVGCDPHAPMISAPVARWAVDFVTRDVTTMLGRFRKGDIGVGETKQESDVRRAVEDFFKLSPAKKLEYQVPKAMLELNLVPFHYIRRRLRLLSSFKNDPRGTARAIEESLRDMVKAEILIQIPPQQVLSYYGLKTEVYAVGPTW